MAVIRYLEIRNNDNVLVIDDNYKNFALKENLSLSNYKISVQEQLSAYDESILNTIFTGQNYMLVNISPFNLKNLLAIQCDVQDLWFATYIHNEILSIYVMKDGKNSHNVEDVQYLASHTKILRYIPSVEVVSSNKCGIQIFNADVETVFDSGKKYLKIVGSITHDYDDVSDIDEYYNTRFSVIPFSCSFDALYNPQIVWYHRQFFRIRNDGNVHKIEGRLKTIYGVPPYDYSIFTGFFYNTNLLVVKEEL